MLLCIELSFAIINLQTVTMYIYYTNLQTKRKKKRREVRKKTTKKNTQKINLDNLIN